MTLPRYQQYSYHDGCQFMSSGFGLWQCTYWAHCYDLWGRRSENNIFQVPLTFIHPSHTYSTTNFDVEIAHYFEMHEARTNFLGEKSSWCEPACIFSIRWNITIWWIVSKCTLHFDIDAYKCTYARQVGIIIKSSYNGL